MMQSRSKAIILVDMDCFYVQVEKKLHPELHGKPCCIVQYNAWKGGSIIAVDYEARKYGISRNLKGDDAKEKCPDVQLVKVPEKRGKADLTNYRRASSEVMKVLSEFTPIIERASIDEAYLDITERVKEYLARTAESIDTSGLASTCIAGQNERDLLSSVEENDEVDHLNSGTDDIIKERLREMATEDPMLVVGAIITQTIREAVYNQTSFTCSAGISYNKMLAKLAAGMNKPNKQTILPLSNVTNLFMSTPFKKVRHLGGKLGAQIQQELNLQYVGQLQEYSLKHLQSKFGQKTGVWLYELCRGHCSESINVRTIPKSIGCSKNFNGPTKLITVDQVHYWLTQLAEELVERLTEDMQENCRKAQSIIVHFLSEGMTSSLSRTFPLHLYDVNYIISSSWEAINKGHESIPLGQDKTIPWTTGILNIHLSASKFISTTSEGQTRSLLSFVTSKVSPNVSPSKARKNKKDTPSSSVNTTQTPKKSDITAYFTPSIKRQSDDIELIDSPVVKKPHPSSEGHCEIYNEIVQDPFSSTVCGVCGETMLVLTLEEHMEYHTALSK